MRICSVGKTDKGYRRQNNEDAFVVATDQNYAAVADGMGGAAAGEVASEIFVTTVTELFSQLSPLVEDEVNLQVREAFRLGNERIFTSAQKTPEYQGMGCTAELIAFFEDRYTVGHVGDSRTYLFRGGELRQLTKDHSLVQHQIDQGLVSVDKARNHSLKNVILRALGMAPILSLDIIRGRVCPNDIFLLCSDGLSDMLSDREIVEVLALTTDLKKMAEILIASALKAGGRDNVTVVLSEVIS